MHALLLLCLAAQAAPDAGGPQALSGRGGRAGPAQIVPAGAVLVDLGAGVAHARDGARTTLAVRAPEARLRVGLLDELLELRAEGVALVEYAREGTLDLPVDAGLGAVRAGGGLRLYEGDGLRWAAHLDVELPAREGAPLGAGGELAGRVDLGGALARFSFGGRWSTTGSLDSRVDLPVVLGVEAPVLGGARAVGELIADTTVFPVRTARVSALVGGAADVAPGLALFGHAGVNIVGGPPSYFALLGASLLFSPP